MSGIAGCIKTVKTSYEALCLRFLLASGENAPTDWLHIEALLTGRHCSASDRVHHLAVQVLLSLVTKRETVRGARTHQLPGDSLLPCRLNVLRRLQ